MGNKIIVGTNTLLQMAKQMYERGELTKKQYLDMVVRNNTEVPEEHKKDIVELSEQNWDSEVDYGNIA